MSLLSLVLGKKKKFTVDALTLDILISESHQRTAVITENPVEDGTIISDHIILEPQFLSINGFVSNSHPTILSFTNLFNNEDKVKAAFELLEEIYFARDLFDVVTNLKVYENMFMESLNIDKGPDTGDVLNFTMELKEIRQVENVTIAIANTKLAARKRAQAQGRKKLGKKSKLPWEIAQLQ
jgi:hypothetical protein